MDPYSLVIGSSMIDIFGFSPNNSSLRGCNAGKVSLSFGGVSRNITENMARIKLNTKFISVFGDDVYGREMFKQLDDLGCDLHYSLVVKNHQSASFLAITDDYQNVLSAIADNNIMKYLSYEYLKRNAEIILNASYCIFDSNDYDLYGKFVSEFKGVNFIVDPVSPFKAKQIKHLLPYLHTIKPNLSEAEVLCGFELSNLVDIKKAGNYFLSVGVKNVFITLDQKGVYFNNGKMEGIISLENVTVKNATGAGDAFVAGIAYGYMNNFRFIDTVKFAYAMSIHNLNSANTVNELLNIMDVLNTAENTKWEIDIFK